MDSPLAVLLTILGILNPSMGQTNNNNNDINITTAAISDRLSLYFYKSTCPRVEQIIEDVIRNQSQKNPGIIPGIMRLHFHDCYITVSLFLEIIVRKRECKCIYFDNYMVFVLTMVLENNVCTTCA